VKKTTSRQGNNYMTAITGARTADEVKRVVDDFANTPGGGMIVLPS
jgi:hypothetical protein